MRLEDIFCSDNWHCLIIGDFTECDWFGSAIVLHCGKERVSWGAPVMRGLGNLKKLLTAHKHKEVLVILDSSIPDFSAWGVTAIFSAWPPELLSRMKLLMLVTRHDWDSKIKVWSDPMVAGYIEMPFLPGELEDVILKPFFLSQYATESHKMT